MTSEGPEWKLCPFCKGTAERRDELTTGVEGVVACVECGARAFASDWNRRADLASGEWRDISSAPKDGSAVLLWHKSGHWVGEWWGGDSVSPAAWLLNGTFDWQPRPTHWMPLPAPPEGVK